MNKQLQADTAQEVIRLMESMQNIKQREVLMGFFKTGVGQYGEGDEFLGIKVPQTREVVHLAKDLSLDEIPILLKNRWHEVRLCGLLLLVSKFQVWTRPKYANDELAICHRDEILKMYLQNAEYANNWDLVDLSAPKILGHWLMLPSMFGGRKEKLKLLDSMASSSNLWKQRMSIVCTQQTSAHGDPSYCLRYSEMLLQHPHDLIHKAVGWMLREMGKRVSMDLLREFLSKHIRQMSRTTLRYAIEKMDNEERKYWMELPHEAVDLI